MGLIRKNIEYGKVLKLSPWRKIALGTWWTAGDPSVYGLLELDVEPALRYLENIQSSTGQRMTVTHFVGKALAETIKRHPSINATLRWGQLYPRKTIDIFFQVASDKTGQDLTGLTIRQISEKSILEISKEMEKRVNKIRVEGDPDYKPMKSNMSLIPGILVKPILHITSFFMYTLNLWSPLLGIPRDTFGSVMITNIGSLGLEIAFVPLFPHSRIPLLIAMAAIVEKPMVINGKIEIKKILPLCATFDHRLIDGVHASHMVRSIKQIFANPEFELKS